MNGMANLDDPSRGNEIRETILSKPSLTALYREFYDRYLHALQRAQVSGLAVEIGAGAGFSADVVPELVASDILAYPKLDVVFDATRMPFADGSLRFICMLNVFHHIPDVGAFLSEAQRGLAPGGRILILDQHRGWISRWILAYAHGEPYDDRTLDWHFTTTGPLSGANGALAWIVFRRDLARFHHLFRNLKVIRYRPHTPLRYWLTGGLKSWNLLPPWLFPLASFVDSMLLSVNENFGSFVEIEIVKTETHASNL